MTLPDERTRSVQYARDFLRDLLDPKKTPRIPKEIRERARRVLRHYPGVYDLTRAAQEVPTLWGKPEEEKYEDLTTINYVAQSKRLRSKGRTKSAKS